MRIGLAANPYSVSFKASSSGASSASKGATPVLFLGESEASLQGVRFGFDGFSVTQHGGAVVAKLQESDQCH